MYSGAAELHDTLPVGHGQVWHVDVLCVALCTVELPNYITHFQWDMAKYGMSMYCMLLCVQWSCQTTLHTSSGTWPSMACWCIVCCSVYSGAAELHDTLPVGHGQVWHVDVLCVALCTVELPNYMTHFQWDMAKYPIRQHLKSIADIITKVGYKPHLLHNKLHDWSIIDPCLVHYWSICLSLYPWPKLLFVSVQKFTITL